MEEKWIWIAAIAVLLAVGIAMQATKPKAGEKGKKVGQKTLEQKAVLTCSDYHDCIKKLLDRGYSKKEIAKFQISCSKQRCVVLGG